MALLKVIASIAALIASLAGIDVVTDGTISRAIKGDGETSYLHSQAPSPNMIDAAMNYKRKSQWCIDYQGNLSQLYVDALTDFNPEEDAVLEVDLS